MRKAAVYHNGEFAGTLVFNFLFSNGDAHLKNFSLLETPNGDYILAPAYDLLNTHLHVNDDYFAPDRGLFADSTKYRNRFHPAKEDFVELGKRIGVSERRIEKLLAPFLAKQPLVESLVSRSFLDERCKRGYRLAYGTRRNDLIG